MKFSLKTREGCKALLALLLVITLVFGFVGILFESDFCKVKSEQISIDYRGGKLTGELFYPWGTNSHDNLPAIIVAHDADTLSLRSAPMDRGIRSTPAMMTEIRVWMDTTTAQHLQAFWMLTIT